MRENNLDDERKIWVKCKKYEKHGVACKNSHISSLMITHDDLKTEILKIFENKIIKIEDFRNYFRTTISEPISYLNSLERALIIKKVNGGWVITSKGISYLRSHKSKMRR